MNKKEVRDKLRILHGDPPHDTWSNYCYGDGYFANSLVRMYGMSVKELEEKSGYNKWKKKKEKAYKKYRKEIGV